MPPPPFSLMPMSFATPCRFPLIHTPVFFVIDCRHDDIY
jgi:hypothetical protein